MPQATTITTITIRPTITTIPTAPTTSIISLSCHWLYYYRYYCHHWLLLLLPLYSHQLLLYITAALVYNSCILLLMYPLSYQLPEQLTAINSFTFTQCLKLRPQLLWYSNLYKYVFLLFFIHGVFLLFYIILHPTTLCYILIKHFIFCCVLY